MFKKHTLQLRIIKTEPQGATAPASEKDLEQINRFAQENMIVLASMVIAVSAARTLLSIIKETAIITAEAKIK